MPLFQGGENEGKQKERRESYTGKEREKKMIGTPSTSRPAPSPFIGRREGVLISFNPNSIRSLSIIIIINVISIIVIIILLFLS